MYRFSILHILMTVGCRSNYFDYFGYIFSQSFYLFFNVRVTGDFIPEMIPLAYNLTPEINDWFTRIDPFTNGMPSLHIAFPFSVWLCLMRYDQDKRWERYRKIVAILLYSPAFSIIYLGIHWFSDIIGGMVVAVLAVHLSRRCNSYGIIWTREQLIREFRHY